MCQLDSWDWKMKKNWNTATIEFLQFDFLNNVRLFLLMPLELSPFGISELYVFFITHLTLNEIALSFMGMYVTHLKTFYFPSKIEISFAEFFFAEFL